MSKGSKRDKTRSAGQATHSLGALLLPHAPKLSAAATTRELEARALEQLRREAAELRRLSEGELMELIFASLNEHNPRVCEGIDFDRILVLADPGPGNRALRGPRHADELDDGAPRQSPHPAPAPLTVGSPSTWVGRGWRDDIPTPTTALLDTPELEPEQRALLDRARGQVHAELNLRHLGRAEGLRHLEVFVRACQLRKRRFVRVIPGKGIESEAEPVLKRLVLAWCRVPVSSEVRTWAPELDRYGEWGSLIVELRLAPQTPGG